MRIQFLGKLAAGAILSGMTAFPAAALPDPSDPYVYMEEIEGARAALGALAGAAAIIIIALTVRRMPYTIRSSTAIISQISPSIEEAAVSLGASELRSFTEVTLPMMMPGVISGAIMSWVTVISELSSSIMLYRGSTQTLTVSVYTEVIRDCFGNAAAYSTVLTVTSVLSLLLFFKLTGRRDISV